ncbi:hypothetical protein EDC63_1078 [Sulfurirhabdus autotrophica]|uniref:Uncharacterized protein n=1 Tax=Sulfurirhabdus autotrophica TaxID=1706046 RepID=A0A4R3Y4J8_9PROT|nr:hypothetical protein EDC63_1078 [Sulfurirhabdus autotrophica]
MLITAMRITVETLATGVYLRIGKRELWLEKSGYKPSGIWEVTKDGLGETKVYALGRSLSVSKSLVQN